MRIGTKSVLFGAHCFFIHPWFVAWGWWKLYGFPMSLPIWVSFFVHDLGYLGKPNMDGPEGETHVLLGARIIGALFDNPYHRTAESELGPSTGKWHRFAVFHSRFWAKQFDEPVSRLCFADKMAIAITPWWLYLPLVTLSGELQEYIALSTPNSKYAWMSIDHHNKREWYENMQRYLLAWIQKHKDGRPDTWTPSNAVQSDPSPQNKGASCNLQS